MGSHARVVGSRYVGSPHVPTLPTPALAAVPYQVLESLEPGPPPGIGPPGLGLGWGLSAVVVHRVSGSSQAGMPGVGEEAQLA